jgi:hypothetical protein
MPVLATFLRKNHRALKLATLNALDVLITNYGINMFMFQNDVILIDLYQITLITGATQFTHIYNLNAWLPLFHSVLALSEQW